MSKQTGFWISLIFITVGILFLSSSCANIAPQVVQRTNEYWNGAAQYRQLEDKVAWTTPEELLQRGYGNCTSFALAKYFSLVQQEGDAIKEHLRLVHVYAKNYKQDHMVVGYYVDARDSNPYVMDILTPKIEKLADRDDLVLVHSFNEQGFWDKDNLFTATKGIVRFNAVMEREYNK